MTNTVQTIVGDCNLLGYHGLGSGTAGWPLEQVVCVGSKRTGL